MRIETLGLIASAVLLPVAAQDKAPDPRTYDYAGQIAALEDADQRDIAPGKAIGDLAGVPNTFRLRTDVPLTAVAAEAVRVSEKLRSEASPPVAGSDGRVLYSYGAGLPTVVCAPLRVCIIELQPGERIEGEPQIGDAVRWHVSPAMYGKGDRATFVLILKPQSPGLDTNLVVTTDRRAYYLRLISKPEDYVARVAFQYPEDDSARKWQIHLQEQRIADREAKRSAEVLPTIVAVEKLNFGYRINGGTEHMRPLRVYDTDRKRTFRCGLS
jgi:type IV secretion system protein VirB9